MKSYKETVKSYRDLDKNIILNAPEGAMWVIEDTGRYYKLANGKMLTLRLDYDSPEVWWESTHTYPDVFSDGILDFIPLPNIEIPWEATDSGKCPVPDGTVIVANARFTDLAEEFWWGVDTEDVQITAYKIIDADYLPSAATVTITEDSATIEPGVVVTVYETVEDKLTKRLEFLQNLANKFPEIRGEAIKFMECELDGYMNTLWEKDSEE